MSILSGTYISSGNTLPLQMIPLSEKDEEWRKDCMDSLETIAISQRNSNLSLIENYEMIKGRFIFSHYFEQDGYQSMLSQLSREFEIPNYLRHYDIISPVINTLLGEWQKMPDLFRVKDWSENAQNEYNRQKTELLTNYVQEEINIRVNQKLMESGLLDAQPQNEEEAQQIQQQIESIRQSMTPPEIEKWMKTTFKTQGEVWAEHRLAADYQKYSLKEKERREFEDSLVADRCFRHYYLTATGYDIETWNPINTFFHKAPEITNVEDGEYAGRNFPLTLSDIIDRYGYLMTQEQIDKLRGDYKKDKTRWAEAKGYNYVYDNYMVPFAGYPGVEIALRNNSPFDKESSMLPYMDSTALNNITRDGIFTTGNGFFSVTEAYWKSQEKLHLITFYDEEGQLVKRIVDENIQLPKGLKKSKLAFGDDQEPNTYVSTYVNRVWKGIKINLGNREESIYLDIHPLEFQFKGDINIYGAKLPVCGQVFSPRNSISMSLVDLMKPHQIGYNVAMNQLYQIAEKEVGAFMIMDVNMFPDSKDWGGEDAYSKWMTIAKGLGMLPIDTSPQNMQGSASAAGGQFPKIINLELGAQMVSRMNMAKFFEEQAYKQVGFNEYRLGSYGASSTAQGVQQGAGQSYAQTDTYFTQFSNYLRRCHRMHLDIAQYVESKKDNVVISYLNDDLTNNYIKILGTDLLLSDLYLFVSNNQETLRQIEALRQLGLNNNTSGATIADLAEVVTTNSPQKIIQILKESTRKQEEMQQQAQQLKQQELEQNAELAKMQEDREDLRKDKELANELEIAHVNAESKLMFNRNYEPSQDDVDQTKNNLQQSVIDLQREKNEIDKEHNNQKLMSDREFKQQELALKNKELDANIQKEKMDNEYAKIMKGKTK